jgi:hypothetical protein
MVMIVAAKMIAVVEVTPTRTKASQMIQGRRYRIQQEMTTSIIFWIHRIQSRATITITVITMASPIK